MPRPPTTLVRTLPLKQGGGPVEIARPAATTEVTALGGHVVWSERRAGRWWLVHAHGRRVAPLPLASSSASFAVDLGAAPDGSPLLLYTRCIALNVCTVHAFDLRRRSDRRMTELEAPGTVLTRASTWRGDVAYARRRAGSPVVEVLLRDGATGKVRRVASEPPLRCMYDTPPGRSCHSEVLSLDLGADLLAHVWAGRFADEYSQPGTLHVLTRADDRDRRLVTGYVSDACGSVAAADAQVHGHVVQYVRRLYNCAYRSSYLHRYDVRTRRETRINPSPLRRNHGGAHAMARDGRDTVWLYSPRTTDFEPSPSACKSGCRLVRSRDLPFRPLRPGDPRASDGAEDTTS